ncbi:MAG: ADOP family duplicated permease [Gemmatimonadota bacterium]
MIQLVRDVRIAFRALRRRPLLLFTATATLALGLGAGTAVFSVIEAALLQPLPFRDADRLAVVWGVAGPEQDIRGASPIEIRDWDDGAAAIGPLALYNETTVNLTGAGEAEQLEAEVVGPGIFDVLGVAPVLGRGLLPEDGVAGAAGSAVISHDLWQRRFGGEADVLGRGVVLDDVAFSIVGVMPQGFRGLSFDTEIWVPLGPFSSPETFTERGSRWLAAIGRLVPGATAETAQEQLDAVAARLAEAYPEANGDRAALLLPMREFYVGPSRALLLMVLGGVGLLLLIACANVANLQLVRAVERKREVALRFALGSGVAQVARHLMVESLVLATLGGVAGVAVAWAGLQLLLPLIPPGVLPAYASPAIDAPVLLFGAATALGAGVLFALVPAARVAREDPAGALRAGGRGATRGAGGRAQRAIIVAEVAVALVLLVAAGLAVDSLRAQLAIRPGFDADGVLAARVTLGSGGYDAESRVGFVEDVVRDLSGVAGVRSAAIASRAPLRGYNAASYIYRAEDPIDADHRVRFYLHGVTPGAFELLGVPLVRGRGFTVADRSEAPAVAVVSQAFAARIWPGQDPVGRRVVFAGDSATVVGVAGNVRQRALTTSLMDPGEDPDVYFPYAQLPTRSFDILVRAEGDPARLTGAVRGLIADRDPSLPLYDVATLTSELDAQTALGRMVSAFLTVFAVLALVAAAIGLFGVLAFVVRGRRAEIAVRAALGAGPRRILRLVVGQGLAMVAMGLAVGILAALAAARFAASQLYGVSATDPVILAGTAMALLAVGVAASALPAIAALRVDPRTAMAEE